MPPATDQKPKITSLQVVIAPLKQEAFANWQADYHRAIAASPNFVSLEFSSIAPEKDGCWRVIQRFGSETASSSWLNSSSYQHQLNELKKLAIDGKVVFSEEKITPEKENVTEVIVTEVQPGMEDAYRRWAAKIHQVEAKFPGFRGVCVQSPKSGSRHWLTLLQFDTIDHLDRWLHSPERKEILEKSFPLIHALETHRVISPYAGWFSSLAKEGALPPAWKQSMVVLLVLFPIVMCEIKFLSPQLEFLSLSGSTFISNAISVSLITFPMMPLAIYLLKWWLSDSSIKIAVLGTLVVLLLYALEILFFNFAF